MPEFINTFSHGRRVVLVPYASTPLGVSFHSHGFCLEKIHTKFLRYFHPLPMFGFLNQGNRSLSLHIGTR
jgi:hypothetical protein